MGFLSSIASPVHALDCRTPPRGGSRPSGGGLRDGGRVNEKFREIELNKPAGNPCPARGCLIREGVLCKELKSEKAKTVGREKELHKAVIPAQALRVGSITWEGCLYRDR